MSNAFQETTEKYVYRARYSAGQIAALTGLPKRTIANWLMGRVAAPRRWQDIVVLAAALRLTRNEADELLRAAGREKLAALRRQAANDADRALFLSWPELAPAPFQVISDLPYFVGREAVMAELKATLQNEQQSGRCVLRGMGGVGKTALAAHLAYHLRDSFPDGALWARLDSSDAFSILAAFAAAYHEDVAHYQDLESRAAAVRAILADKRALIVLDNAETSDQVRPLLPPTTGKTAVIITTRHDLAVADQMRHLVLEPFAPQGKEALALFGRFLDKAIMRQYERELRQIAALLGQLPLALAIAAGQLAGWTTIPDYLIRLQNQDHQLDALTREDRSVRLSFDLSFQALTAEMQAFFANLGAFGGDDFSVTGAAAVAQVTEDKASQFLIELARRSLAQISLKQRYALHPLLQTYAREKQPDSGARRRMIAFFTNYAHKRERDFPALIQEMSNFYAALDDALSLQLHEAYGTAVLALAPVWQVQGSAALALPYIQQALKLADGGLNRQQRASLLMQLGRYRWQLGQSAAAREDMEKALSLAYEEEDVDLVCQLLTNLGVIAGYNEADYDRAIAYFSEALPYARALNNVERLGLLLSNLANAYYEQGDWPQAAVYWQESADLFATKGQTDNASYVRLLHNLGVMALDMGRLDRAEAYLQKGLRIAQDLQFMEIGGAIVATLGQLATQRGQFAQAESWLAQALATARQLQLPENTSLTLGYYATLATRQGRFADADAYLQEARTIAQEAQIAWLQLDVLLRDGELRWRQANLMAAQTAFTEALRQAETLGVAELQASALWGLARIAATQEESERLGREALRIFDKMGHQKAVEIRQWLKSLS